MNVSPRESSRHTHPKVTVLTPTYNRPDYLVHTIGSVVNQTLTDWEMLVINDGGEDVGGLVSSFDDPRIHYYDRTRNRGKASCLNFALRRARGEYIAYIDDDDLWYPHHLETLSRQLDDNPDKGAAYSDLYAVQFVRSDINAERFPLNKQIRVARHFNRDFLFHYNHTLHVSLMHRKKLALKAGGYDEHVTVLIDWNMTRKLAFYTDFIYVPQLTGEYYLPVGKSDRISNVEREDSERYLHNLRKIKADLPPGPWPYVKKVGVIMPVYVWNEGTVGFITALIDKISYPVRYFLVNNDMDLSLRQCRQRLGKIGTLGNVHVCAPRKALPPLDSYRFGARKARGDFVYLPSPHADTSMDTRIISGMHYIEAMGCAGVKWNVPQELEGPFDILISTDEFLARSDSDKGSMEAVLNIVPAGVPKPFESDFFASMAMKEYEKGNLERAFECVQRAESTQRGGTADQFLMDLYSKICFDLKKYDEGEKKCRLLIERGYGADNWVRLGKILQKEGKYEEATDAYGRGLKDIGLRAEHITAPTFPVVVPEEFGAFSALMGMGECMVKTGSFTEAAKTMRMAGNLKANSHRPLLGFGTLFLKTGQLAGAEEALVAALKTGGERAEVHRALGEVREAQGADGAAFSLYSKALSLDGTDGETVEALYRVGSRLGKWSRLKDALSAYLQFRPAALNGMKYLSTVYLRLGDNHNAERIALRGLSLFRDDRDLVECVQRARRSVKPCEPVPAADPGFEVRALGGGCTG